MLQHSCRKTKVILHAKTLSPPLLAGAPGAFVPGEVSRVALGARGLDRGLLQLVGPAVLLAQGDGALLVGEGHLGQITGGDQ